MKALALILVFVFCGTFIRADTIELSITGSIGRDFPLFPFVWDSSVPEHPGSVPYSFTVTFDNTIAVSLQGPIDPSGGGTFYHWNLGPSGSETISFGDYSLTANDLIAVASSFGPPSNSSLLVFRATGEETTTPYFFDLAASINLDVPLDGSALANIPNILLPENFVEDGPFGESELEILNTIPPEGGALSGDITSFSVQDLSVPEPSTWALLLGGLGLLAFWQIRTRRIVS